MSRQSENSTFYFLGKKGMKSETDALLKKSGKNENYGSQKKKTDLKLRKMPIKVEPKVYFANERTFLAWLHTSVILAAASVSIVAFADQNPYSQMYGIMLLPVSIAFIIYALRQYTHRAKMIRRLEPGPYEDLWGPTVLSLMLMMAILANFLLKIYSMN